MEFIYEIKNALPKEECEELIQRFLKDDKKELGAVGGKVDHEVRKSTNVWVTPNSDVWGNKMFELHKIFVNGLNKYADYLGNSNYITVDALNYLFKNGFYFKEPYVNEMKEGEYYDWHMDDNTKVYNQERRTFSCLIYLNTLEEDQGGCTEFMCGKKVRPEQGKMLIFPSAWTYEHRAAEVKNGGVKYTCGTWVG